MRRLILSGLVVLLVLQGASVHAATYPLQIFTDNGQWGTGGSPGPYDPNLDMWVEVYNGAGTVSFEFHNENDPSVGGIITDVYFDDGTLLGISQVINGPGVLFEQCATPGDLPGGNLLYPPFQTTGQFSADSDPPVPHNGVNIGEWVIIQFDLMPGGTIDDVIAELADGTLRIGAHIQALADGTSESAIAVPEPATLVFFALGMLGVVRRRW